MGRDRLIWTWIWCLVSIAWRSRMRHRMVWLEYYIGMHPCWNTSMVEASGWISKAWDMVLVLIDLSTLHKSDFSKQTFLFARLWSHLFILGFSPTQMTHPLNKLLV